MKREGERGNEWRETKRMTEKEKVLGKIQENGQRKLYE